MVGHGCAGVVVFDKFVHHHEFVLEVLYCFQWAVHPHRDVFLMGWVCGHSAEYKFECRFSDFIHWYLWLIILIRMFSWVVRYFSTDSNAW